MDSPSIRRALARSAEKALRAGRGVAVHGLRETAVDTAPCHCHVTMRVWPDQRHGRWLLLPRVPSLPTTTLVPTRLAAQAAAAIVVGAPVPTGLCTGPPLGLWWRTFSSATLSGTDRRVLVDEHDVADAVSTLRADEHLEVTGPFPSCAAAFPTDNGGWGIELLTIRGLVDRHLHVAERADLPSAIYRAITWVIGER